MILNKLFLFVVGSALSFNLLALTGKVVSISDGDTISIIDSGNVRHNIRLAGIDAPEKSQKYGSASKDNLSKLVYMRTVSIEDKKRDKYGRIVGKVILDDVDVCLSQISSGLAWHYVKYANEQSTKDRQAYSQAEIKARKKMIGLWGDPSPTPPWDFRNKIK